MTFLVKGQTHKPKVIVFRVTEAMHKGIKEIARQNNLTMDDLVRQMVEYCLNGGVK